MIEIYLTFKEEQPVTRGASLENDFQNWWSSNNRV